MTEIREIFGVCVPDAFVEWSRQLHEIHPNYVARHRGRWARLKNFLAWDKGWGFPLRGGPLPRMRDLFPVHQVQRGPINYTTGSWR